jgi:hypothetical protein
LNNTEARGAQGQGSSLSEAFHPPFYSLPSREGKSFPLPLRERIKVRVKGGYWMGEDAVQKALLEAMREFE